MEKKMTITNPSVADVEKHIDEKFSESTPIKIAEDEPVKKKENPFEPKPFVFILPSGHFIKNPAVVDGMLSVRRMTTIEEAIIQMGIAEKANKKEALTINTFFSLFNDVFNNCIKTNISALELTVSDKISLIVAIIANTYGSKVEDEYTCSFCGKTQKVVSDISNCKVKVLPDDFLPKEITLSSYDFPVTISLTIPTLVDEACFFSAVPDIVKQFECIVKEARGTKPDGTEITNKDIKDIVSNLNVADKKELTNFITTIFDFGIELKIEKGFDCNNAECEGREHKKSERLQPVEISIESIFNKLL